MNRVFEAIYREQPKLPGWCSMEKAFTLASIVMAQRPAITVEVGIYGGSSLLPILLAHQGINFGIVYGIEPWSVEEAMKAQTTAADVEWWSKQNFAKLEDDLTSVMKRLGLEEFFRLVRKPSRQANPIPGTGVLHIDGAHSDQAIQDVVRFAQQVELGGYVIMDDLQWAGGGVQRAVQRLSQMGYKQLYLLGTGAVFQRLK